MMIEFVKGILIAQLEAGLSMMRHSIELCPPDHWESKIAKDTFRQVAYHTLFYVDYYLSPNEKAFQLSDLNLRGGDERTSTSASLGLEQDETLNYVTLCRKKAVSSIATETTESLQRDSGFHRLRFTRGELHVYNIRHLQHHVGALSAYLRRIGRAVDWVGSGWRTV